MNSDKKRIRNLRILVGVLIAFVAVDFFASLSFYSDYERNEELTNAIAKDIDGLYDENIRLSKELQKYEVDKNYLISIGASEDQAIKIIKASKVHDVDPK